MKKHSNKRIARRTSAGLAQPSVQRTAGLVQLHARAAGFSLIELMIAMVIGLLIMSGVFQVFMSSKHSDKVLQAEAEMQENARFAFSVMTSIIQQAGNFGCQASTSLVTRNAVTPPGNPATDTFKPARIIEGWEASNTGYGDSYTTHPESGVSRITTQHWSSSNNAVKDAGTKSKKYSDILKVWYSRPEKATLTNIDHANSVLTFSGIDLKKGDVLVINDCQTVNFAQVCKCEDDDCDGTDTQANIKPGVCNTPGNQALNLRGLNMPTAEVGILDQAIFFVGKRSDNVTGYQKNQPSLYVRHLGDKAKPGSKEEILEGVESLQILYGEDTNNDNSPNYYVSADKVVNWKNVVSLKLSLLLRSRKNNMTNPAQTLSFNGETITLADGDRYLRRVFTTTIALRNRTIGF